MEKNFEDNNPQQEGREMSAEEQEKKKELKRRIFLLKKIAETYQNAELEELIESIKELIANDEIEKADKSLDKTENRAKEIQDEKMSHPYEGAKQTLFHQIGYEIAKLREKRTLNINDLSEQSGTKASRIEAIEKGEAGDVTLDELYKLAKAMNCDIRFEIEERFDHPK